ncbi:MAG: DEAD/DEAH box helicase [Eubacteriales bacterium]|nr:DEAD/DEAH box helicase [Eubacteriales bacterium]
MNYTEIKGLSVNLVNALNNQSITQMTPIQQEAYRFISDNRDVVACSSTGSGKTLAYLVPIINKLDLESKHIQSIILVPTQELAVQVHEQIMLLFENAHIGLFSQFLIGDGNINRQAESLKNKPAIIVGTPARISQLIKMKKLRVHDVKTLVIDEADKMMDKTYFESVLAIRRSLMKFTQVLLFSASVDKKTRICAESLTYKAVMIDISKTKNNEAIIPKTIKHIYIVADRRERIETMRKIAKAASSNKTLVFINTKYDLEESLQKLEYHHYSVAALSGNQNKFEKKKALEGFKSGTIQYLLATDVAARGLQIDDVETVINVNLPEDSKEYLHRAGRCGRNGKQGLCISIITENEINKIKKYQKDFHINILQKRLYQGKIVAK